MDSFDDLFIFVPSATPAVGQIIMISEGSGDNLLKEDIAEGYQDYINYEIYDVEQGMPEADGGMVMYKELVGEKFEKLSDAIPDVLDMAYGNKNIPYIILDGDAVPSKGIAKSKRNEAMISGYVYFKTDAEDADEALNEFKATAESVGINADNMAECELRIGA